MAEFTVHNTSTIEDKEILPLTAEVTRHRGVDVFHTLRIKVGKYGDTAKIFVDSLEEIQAFARSLDEEIAKLVPDAFGDHIPLDDGPRMAQYDLEHGGV
jgi:hypothetical protein